VVVVLLAILPEGALASALGFGALCVVVFQLRRAGTVAWQFVAEQAFRGGIRTRNSGDPYEVSRAFPDPQPIRDFEAKPPVSLKAAPANPTLSTRPEPISRAAADSTAKLGMVVLASVTVALLLLALARRSRPAGALD
jgi:hypothetical protein